MSSTNYCNAFITVSPDSTATNGREPEKAGSVAQIQYALLRERPYHFTSDDLLFEIHARRKQIAAADHQRERAAFFAKPQACLRASPLVKQYGWGLHHDENGKVALHGVETANYRRLSSQESLKIVSGLRSRKS